ncbi:MAG: SHOCT domain-containing protein [Actinomycetota bacterium]
MAPQEPVASVAPTEAASSTDETADALKQLADLHAQGILTDEEFAAKKKQILGI